jgi:hypothetical protein
MSIIIFFLYIFLFAIYVKNIFYTKLFVLLLCFILYKFHSFAPPWTAALHLCQQIPGFIAFNVPAVYDGLTARIEKCVAFIGLANCGCSEPWEWSVAE